MLKQFKYKDITWIDLENPTAQEIDKLGIDRGLEPRVLSELSQPSRVSKVEAYTNYFYLVLHFPHEVDFIVGKNFIITTHYELVNEVNDFAKIFETDFRLKKNAEALHAGFILFYILREMYQSVQTKLQGLNDRLRLVETKVFSDREREVVRSLFAINRELLDYHWVLRPHAEVLESLAAVTEEFFNSKSRHQINLLKSDHLRVWQAVENNQTTFSSLQEATESLLTIKTNETMKALTVAAFIFLPVTLISQIFGMNTGGLPLVDTPRGFHFALALMAVTVGLLYYLARRRQWI